VTSTEVSEPELYRRTVGAGPDVVFCHGFAGSGRNWGMQVRALSSSHRCTVYDARGHARSPAKLEPRAFAFDRLVADVGRVLDAIGAEHSTTAPRTTLVGLSLGAATALEFALTEPARVRGLVLASPPPTDGERRQWAVEFADALETEGVERAGERFVWGERSRLDVQGAASVRRGFLEHDPVALAHVLRQSLARLPDLTEQAGRLDRLEIPTLIVAGETDVPSVAAAHDLASLVRDSELVVIPGAGHVVNLAAPSDFLAATQRLLAKTNERGDG
jgi:pimeloyl-ACP methyl ester carboxylesterase